MKALLHSSGSVVLSLALLLAQGAYGRPAIVECVSETGDTSAKFWEDMAYRSWGRRIRSESSNTSAMLRFALGLPFEKRYSFLDQGSLAMANQRIAQISPTHAMRCGRRRGSVSEIQARRDHCGLLRPNDP